jgi:protein phosphatase
VKWDDRLDIAGLTDVGMRRSNNQDSFRVLLAPSSEQWQRRGHVFVVADGMGAHAVGELASKMAVDSIPHTYHKLANLPCPQAIAKAVEDANTLIHNRGKANADFQGMGTTSTALVLLPEGAYIAHVGDSRAYRVRSGQVEQLSFDHSLAWELVRRRQMTVEQARAVVPNNVITRSLGPEPNVEVDVEGLHTVEPGDVFVLCSDGLSGQVSDAEIGAIARSLPAQAACQCLVDMANLRGGPDNITLIVVHVGDAAKNKNRTADDSRATRVRDWPKLCLTLGLASLVVGALAAAGGLLLDGSVRTGVFALGVVVGLIGAGLAAGGFFWRRWNAPKPPAKAPAPPGAYRHAACALDDAFFERFIARLQQLRAVAVEKAWNVDWTQFFAHRNAADKFNALNDRVAALRELCEAQRLLADAQKRFQEQTHSLLGLGGTMAQKMEDSQSEGMFRSGMPEDL